VRADGLRACQAIPRHFQARRRTCTFRCLITRRRHRRAGCLRSVSADRLEPVCRSLTHAHRFNEANFDVQYAMGVAGGIPTSFLTVGGLTTQDETGLASDQQFATGLFDTTTYLTTTANPPTVVTTSYGFQEEHLSPQVVQWVERMVASRPCLAHARPIKERSARVIWPRVLVAFQSSPRLWTTVCMSRTRRTAARTTFSHRCFRRPALTVGRVSLACAAAPLTRVRK
jgi:hypothetical protein